MLQGFRIPKDNANYEWTRHAIEKMIYYKMGEGLVKRVIRAPKRTEDGIAPDTIAVMKPTQSKHTQEYWVMYREIANPSNSSGLSVTKKRIISAWRYPGVSPVNSKIPIPDEILRELEEIDF